MKKFLILLTLLCSISLVPTASADVLPEFDDNEPVVTIRHGEKATYFEYRVNGKLKEIKVKPVVGKTYYLRPTEEGEFQRFEDSSLMLPKWILFSW
ncbi:Protein of unknown function [Amphritea atlantica]|uniref:DUF2782 domain-containing protein n=1 Tax=Amphritea atlantica TaxID=355243 RepID=A0A1H9E3B6_9GAMM|nr:DUF2782 domain-containing protein [Amphritea atlantica]SEQ20085.1 Protein of unknown function [Amphritea atlantica]